MSFDLERLYREAADFTSDDPSERTGPFISTAGWFYLAFCIAALAVVYRVTR